MSGFVMFCQAQEDVRPLESGADQDLLPGSIAHSRDFVKIVAGYGQGRQWMSGHVARLLYVAVL
jgi:hypothetical protein